MISLKENADKSITWNDLDESFESVGISPLKFHGIPSQSKIPLAKKTINGKGKSYKSEIYKI